MLNLYKDRAFRLCSLSFSHILVDDNVASDQHVVYTVVPLVPVSSSGDNVIVLLPMVKNVLENVTAVFLTLSSCEVKSQTTSKSEQFYIISDRESSTSAFLLNHTEHNGFTLKSHLQDISIR